MHDPVPPADIPVLDAPYLDDMRGWVGEDALDGLLAFAPDSLSEMADAIRAAWARGDTHAVNEAGHRLKGGAGSIACRRMADLGHTIQLHPDLGDRGPLEALDSVQAETVAAILAYREEMRTPVPPSPQ